MLGHLVMIALMSMTPVHLDHGGATLTVVGLVISAHVAGIPEGDCKVVFPELDSSFVSAGGDS